MLVCSSGVRRDKACKAPRKAGFGEVATAGCSVADVLHHFGVLDGIYFAARKKLI